MSALIQTTWQKICTQQLYPHKGLLFVHRTQDVMFNSCNNQEFAPVPHNEGNMPDEIFGTNILLQIFLHLANYCLVVFLQCTHGWQVSQAFSMEAPRIILILLIAHLNMNFAKWIKKQIQYR